MSIKKLAKLYFVAGASGSGKTAIMQNLRKIFRQLYFCTANFFVDSDDQVYFLDAHLLVMLTISFALPMCTALN